MFDLPDFERKSHLNDMDIPAKAKDSSSQSLKEDKTLLDRVTVTIELIKKRIEDYGDILEKYNCAKNLKDGKKDL